MDKLTRMKWPYEALKFFLESCIEEKTNVGLNGASLRKESWANLAKKMDKVHRLKLSQKQLKNQFDHLKARYRAWSYLRNRTGNTYNPATNTFNLSNEEWNEFNQGHPKLKTLKNAPLLFPELCTKLFESSSASGPRVKFASSNIMRSRDSSSSYNSTIHSLRLDDDDVCIQYNSNEVSTQAISRPKKKKKKKDNLDELIKVCTTELTEMTQTQKTESQEKTREDKCIEKLNALGLNISDPLYCLAFSIFAHSTLQQDWWLKMPLNLELQKNWLRNEAKILGLLKE